MNGSSVKLAALAGLLYAPALFAAPPPPPGPGGPPGHGDWAVPFALDVLRAVGNPYHYRPAGPPYAPPPRDPYHGPPGYGPPGGP